jgi:hypothetical protein
MVERWFGQITQKRIRRGAFKSVPQLIEAIQDCLKQYNEDPTRFVWTQSVDMILETIARCKAALGTGHQMLFVERPRRLAEDLDVPGLQFLHGHPPQGRDLLAHVERHVRSPRMVSPLLTSVHMKARRGGEIKAILPDFRGCPADS